MAGEKGLFDNDEPSWALMLFLVAMWIVCAVIWRFYEAEFLTALRYFRMAELSITGLFLTEHKACFNWIQAASLNGGNPTEEAYRWANICFRNENIQLIPTADALSLYNVSATSIGVIGKKIGALTKWPIAAACLAMAYYAMFKSKRNWFKQTFTLESFIKTQVKMWPVIAPIVNFIPAKFSARIPGERVPDKIPPMAESFSPEEWISYHRIPVVNGIPDREATRRAYLLQLGPRWTGIDCLTVAQQVLFAAFALKGVQKREEADDILSQVAPFWNPQTGLKLSPELLSKIKKINNDPDVGGRALTEANKFAYRTTALMGCLKWARSMGGVLAPAQFIWVRAEDRALWYPLNNLGRRAFHAEGAGAMAHYMAEVGAQKPLPVPRLDTAIVTLNQYLSRDAVKIPSREEPVLKSKK